MNRRAQQLDHTGKHGDGTHGECAACAAPASHYVVLRSPAETLNVCGRHESMARGSLFRFLKHVATKETFLDDPDAAKEEVRRRIEREKS